LPALNFIETINGIRSRAKFLRCAIPVYEVCLYYDSIIKSRFRQQLEEKWGKQLFAIAEVVIKTHSPEIVEDLKIENKLKTDYTKLLASAKIIFEGEERNLSGLVPFMESQP
jgi:hypothetical protein